MTVKELKEELDKYSDDLIVYVPRTCCSMALVAKAIKVTSRGNALYIED